MKCFIFSSRCSSLSHVLVYQIVGGLQQNRARVSTLRQGGAAFGSSSHVPITTKSGNSE